MGPGRVYTAVFEGISVSAVQDLFEIQSAASVVIALLEVHITQDTDETSQQLPVQIIRVPATFTSGNGTAVTPRKTMPGDPTSVVTVERNATTVATTSGTLEPLRRMGDNVLNGWHWVFTPETCLWLGPGAATSGLVVRLPTAPGAAITMSGEIAFMEIG